MKRSTTLCGQVNASLTPTVDPYLMDFTAVVREGRTLEETEAALEEQITRLREVRSRRFVQPVQLADITYTPLRQFQHQGSQVCLQNLCCGVRHQVAVFRPEAKTLTCRQAPGAATALRCRCL